jgi:hypothetical protein
MIRPEKQNRRFALGRFVGPPKGVIVLQAMSKAIEENINDLKKGV